MRVFISRYVLPCVPFQHEKKIEERKDVEKKDEQASVDDHRDSPPRKKRGMNKNRPRLPNPTGKDKICRKFLEYGTCQFGDSCNFSHDMKTLIDNRLPDLGETCRNFQVFGKCPYGLACRFGKEHLTDDFKNITKDSYNESYLDLIKNSLTKELQVELRKKRIPFPRSEEFLKKMRACQTQRKPLKEMGEYETRTGAITDEDIIKLRSVEKKKVVHIKYLRGGKIWRCA